MQLTQRGAELTACPSGMDGGEGRRALRSNRGRGFVDKVERVFDAPAAAVRFDEREQERQ